jgi:hypothetical protein
VTVRKRNSGGTSTTLATIKTDTAGWSAWTEIAASVSGSPTLGSGDVVTIEVTKTGTGVALPPFLVVVDTV